jgi:acetyltransferase-like isoleucine patch superfamily enzyme
VKRGIQRILAHLVAWLCGQPAAAQHHGLVERGLLVIGRHTYGAPHIWNYHGSERKVTIGSFCSIGPNVEIITGGIHPTDWISTYPFRVQWKMKGAFEDGMPSSNGEVVIGSDVWLGTGATLLSGVHIGHGSVVAAKSVVTKDVPPYAMVAGVPAKIIRYRFDPEIIQRLLEIAWWEWDDARIREAVPRLSSSHVDAFLQFCSARDASQTAS